MNIETLREYCLSLPNADEYLPYGPDTLAFTIGGKHFALVSLDDSPFRVNLKCDPKKAEEYREKYQTVEPGYHMNKKHWNSIYPGRGELTDRVIKYMISHSYELVKSKLPKKLRESLD